MYVIIIIKSTMIAGIIRKWLAIFKYILKQLNSIIMPFYIIPPPSKIKSCFSDLLTAQQIHVIEALPPWPAIPSHRNRHKDPIRPILNIELCWIHTAEYHCLLLLLTLERSFFFFFNLTIILNIPFFFFEIDQEWYHLEIYMFHTVATYRVKAA